MTKFQIWQKVRRHLLKQKRAAVYRNLCRYRTETATGLELKCAVGCLIDDEAYSPKLEGWPVESPEVVDALRASGIKNAVRLVPFLKELQSIHDYFPVSEWKNLLNILKPRKQ